MTMTAGMKLLQAQVGTQGTNFALFWFEWGLYFQDDAAWVCKWKATDVRWSHDLFLSEGQLTGAQLCSGVMICISPGHWAISESKMFQNGHWLENGSPL